MDCTKYQVYYYSYIEKDFQAIPPKALAHLRSCPTCRDEIEQLERTLNAPEDEAVSLTHKHLELHFGLLNRQVDCDAVKPLLPCLAMASLPVYCRTPVTAHLEACPACEADFQTLRALSLTDSQLLSASRFLLKEATESRDIPDQAMRVLEAIRRRPSSGVQTCTTLTGQEHSAALHVTASAPRAQRTASARPALRWAMSGLAAAVILGAVVLFVGTPPAEALDLRQFYDALARVQNVSIDTTTPEEVEPIQRLWISQTQGLKLFESPEKTVLYDAGAGTMKLRSNLSQQTEIRLAEAAPEEFQLPWGLLPFRDVTQIPEGYRWERIDTLADGQIAVYALSWSEPLSGSRTIEKKWIGYLEQSTFLPQKIEWYERFGDQTSYRLLMTTVVRYPRTEELLEAVLGSGL